MKHLSKSEMKKVSGGLEEHPTVDTVYCNDGTSHPLPGGDCSCGSAGECDGHGGVKQCEGWGHPVTNIPD